jgi:hypothetical protein
MSFLEGANVGVNVRNNNNIVWKNVTVQDMWPGPLMLAPIWLRNLDPREIIPVRLELRLPPGNEKRMLELSAKYPNLTVVDVGAALSPGQNLVAFEVLGDSPAFDLDVYEVQVRRPAGG